jgi:hypothetical protein
MEDLDDGLITVGDFTVEKSLGYIPIGNVSTGVYNVSTSAPFNSGVSSIDKCINTMSSMLNTMQNIANVYSLIDIQNDDIFVTLKDTGEVLSVNALVKEHREKKECIEQGSNLRDQSVSRS